MQAAAMTQEAQLQRLAVRLKSLRVAAKQSQAMVAEAIRISRTAYSTWENGRQAPQLWNLRELANHFGVEIGYFTDERCTRPRLRGSRSDR